MKIFISWSGDLAREIGDLINKNIKQILRSPTFYSPKNIASGEIWLNKIMDELEHSNNGILIMTKENIESNWILFEAGAISGSLGRSKVTPILFDIGVTDLPIQLNMFNCTLFEKENYKALLSQYNESLDSNGKLDHEEFDELFNKLWSDLSANINNILKKNRAKKESPKKVKIEDKIDQLLLILKSDSINNRKNFEFIFNVLNIFQNTNTKDSQLKTHIESGIPVMHERKRINESNFLHIYYSQGSSKLEKIIFQVTEVAMIPDYVNTGYFNYNIENERYDFSYIDNDGYTTTIEGVNRNFNPNNKILKAISSLIENDINKELLLNFINSINETQFFEIRPKLIEFIYAKVH